MDWPTKYQIKRWFKDFFYFPKSDRKVLLLLCVLFTGIVLYKLWQVCRPVEGIRPLTRQERTRLDSFLTRVEEGRQARADSFARVRVAKRFSDSRSETTLFFFDPNTADSVQLSRLGFRSWQIRNLVKYRNHGGLFRQVADLSRLYGMEPEFYERLKPYVRIAPRYSENTDRLARTETPEKPHKTMYGSQEWTKSRHTGRDTAQRLSKFSEGVVVDLNQADTSLLKRIPGIGSAYARMIISYRERLGGYVNPEQLLELEMLPERITRWFCVSGAPRPILVNEWPVTRLKRHPYLNFYQARVLVDHRRKYGPLHSLDELSLYPEFTASDLERLQPYVQF